MHICRKNLTGRYLVPIGQFYFVSPSKDKKITELLFAKNDSKNTLKITRFWSGAYLAICKGYI